MNGQCTRSADCNNGQNAPLEVQREVIETANMLQARQNAAHLGIMTYAVLPIVRLVVGYPDYRAKCEKRPQQLFRAQLAENGTLLRPNPATPLNHTYGLISHVSYSTKESK